jgi:hypothetical protein
LGRLDGFEGANGAVKGGRLMQGIFELATACFALAAAIFWFISAAKNFPKISTGWGGGMPDDHPFALALGFTTRMNRLAAAFSGLSALCAFASYLSKP